MRFEKVRYEAFRHDMLKYFPYFSLRGIEKIYDEIKIPERQTAYSAGYDFSSPVFAYLDRKDYKIIPTGIKCRFDEKERESWHLKLYIRSSIGIKKGIVLANGTGIIDADYYNNPDNDGDILIAIRNESKISQCIEAGERIMQGVFELHGLVVGDNASGRRDGGVGSTGR